MSRWVPFISRVTMFVVAFAMAASYVLAQAVPPEPTLRFGQTVDYKPGVTIELQARVGTIRILSIEFKPGKTGRKSTLLTAVVDGENIGPDDWFVSFKVNLLDDAGQVIWTGSTYRKCNAGRIVEANLYFSRVSNDVLSRVKRANIRITAEMD